MIHIINSTTRNIHIWHRRYHNIWRSSIQPFWINKHHNQQYRHNSNKKERPSTNPRTIPRHFSILDGLFVHTPLSLFCFTPQNAPVVITLFTPCYGPLHTLLLLCIFQINANSRMKKRDILLIKMNITYKKSHSLSSHLQIMKMINRIHRVKVEWVRIPDCVSIQSISQMSVRSLSRAV